MITDVIRIIIKNVTQKKSLYTFLFVNRLWFEITIPLLWNNPWSYLPKYRNNISKTILSCCDTVQKRTLYRRGIITSTQLTSPPLFNYVSYINNLSKEIIGSLVQGILDEFYEKNGYDVSHDDLLQEIFWDLFMTKCFKLKSLILPNYSICHIKDSSTCLRTLVKLTCSTFIPDNYFLDLSEICHHLREIKIYCHQDSKGLAKFIESQDRLKTIELISTKNNDVSCPLIGEALSTRSQTITCVKIQNDLCISPEFLNSLNNCKEFIIDMQSESDFDLGQLELIHFPLLETLHSHIYQRSESLALNSLSNFISSSNATLLKGIDIHFISNDLLTESIKKYLGTITRSCSLLEYVVIWVRRDVLSDLESFLKRCDHLKEIEFVAVELNGALDAKSIFDILMKNNLPTLSKIVFKEKWNFTKGELNEFLENWNVCH
ncbi:9880_t:CDS:2 [Funneliformis mosseae]|uniref:9880_t:CDS:1 n=1 Tax=Funneliformis mosseae TaxID=27381 RepID=A0A9N9CL64_FUNMO|nr:9880_t:CDS:2 [Funneliformis mosseae]